jgi:hypothetical protein
MTTAGRGASACRDQPAAALPTSQLARGGCAVALGRAVHIQLRGGLYRTAGAAAGPSSAAAQRTPGRAAHAPTTTGGFDSERLGGDRGGSRQRGGAEQHGHSPSSVAAPCDAEVSGRAARAAVLIQALRVQCGCAGAAGRSRGLGPFRLAPCPRPACDVITASVAPPCHRAGRARRPDRGGQGSHNAPRALRAGGQPAARGLLFRWLHHDPAHQRQ